MLGRDVPHDVVPYFYSVLGRLGRTRVRRARHRWDEEIVRGSTDDGEFTNWYLTAVASPPPSLSGVRTTSTTHGG